MGDPIQELVALRQEMQVMHNTFTQQQQQIERLTNAQPDTQIASSLAFSPLFQFSAGSRRFQSTNRVDS